MIEHVTLADGHDRFERLLLENESIFIVIVEDNIFCLLHSQLVLELPWLEWCSNVDNFKAIANIVLHDPFRHIFGSPGL